MHPFQYFLYLQAVLCEQVHCHNPRSMNCWQKVWVISVLTFSCNLFSTSN
jgi:hypothetical protein